MPWEFVNLPRDRKAALVAMIDERIAQEKKEAARMRKK
jgi:hypothetical protein